MRTMLKVRLETAAANAAIGDGSIRDLVGRAMAELEPEAAYFYPEGGRRCALFVFEMTDSAKIPPVTEPFMLGLNAEIELTPVMNVDDLTGGLSELGQAAAAA